MTLKPERLKKDIVDNTQSLTMQKILNSGIPQINHLDISTGYFDVQGYGMLRKSLEESIKDDAFTMRLLLGKDAIFPTQDSFEKYAQQYKIPQIDDVLSLKASLDESDFTRESRTHTTSLIAFLNHQSIQVRIGASRFNHSKCYILGDDSVFIGSSNFTKGGLVGNYELNAGLYQPGAIVQTRNWFERMWSDATDTKKDLISVLSKSKFGAPSTPFEVYMKILFERFKPLLAQKELDTKSSDKLTKFQQDAVRTGMFIMAEFGGTIIADATGLGKTNMGLEIVRQKILKEGKKVLLIAPAQVLDSMWEEKFEDEDFTVREKLSIESLGRVGILDNPRKYRNIDLVVIDESQNFRSKNTNRRKNLMKLMSIGKSKQALLLTATPINNSLMDLYYQLLIITGGNDAYFYKTIGIASLHKHMRAAANKEGLQQGLEKIQQILDNVMVRRTRSYIKDVYKDDRINGKEIKFPKHEYQPIRYSLSEMFGNVFEKLLEKIESLSMAPYQIEQYNFTVSLEEKRKHQVRAHLQIILLLKRFESSVEAVKKSIGNKIRMYRYVNKILHKGEILRIKDFNKITTKWSDVDSSDDSERNMDDEEEYFMQELEKIPKDSITKDYDIEKLKNDMRNDMKILDGLLKDIEGITIDEKVDTVVRNILKEKILETESKKVLIFTEYTATAKYITKQLKEKIKNKNIQCITGKTKKDTRKNFIRQFAPKSNLDEDEKLDTPEIDVLVSTEVLAEGQNLQDCNYVINYDLPWNPMRIVQRTGRIDRLTSAYDVIHSRACYPDKELDKLLKLIGKLTDKIDTVNETIGLDTEVLGEMPTPKQFNGTIKQRIEVLAGKDSQSEKIIQDLERESDIMPQLSPINEIGRYIKEKGIEFMKDIPMGRRSGKKGEKAKVVLAYLKEKPGRQVYFVIHDYKNRLTLVPDDDFEAIRDISCEIETPLYLPMDGEDHQESFEMLLDIDQKARVAIKERNSEVLSDVRNSQKDMKKQYDKNISKIYAIVPLAVKGGYVSKDDGKLVISIIESKYLRSWEDNIRDLLVDYDRSNEVKSLITGIKTLGEYIGLKDKTEPVTVTDDDSNIDLKLVGAMFILDEKTKLEPTKTGLDKY